MTIILEMYGYLGNKAYNKELVIPVVIICRHWKCWYIKHNYYNLTAAALNLFYSKYGVHVKSSFDE